MKKILALIADVFWAFSVCMAQQTVSLSDLTGTEWRRDDNRHCRFTSTEMIWLDFSNDSIESVLPYLYYISNEDMPYTQNIFEETGKLFNHDRVGKGLVGAYLITYNPPVDDTSSLIVTYLGNDSLLLSPSPYEIYVKGPITLGNKKSSTAYRRVNNITPRATVEVCNWIYQRQTQHGDTVYDYKNNRYMHLDGPNGGYDVWIPYMAGAFDQSKLQPQPQSEVYKNNQCICLSNIFAVSKLEQMYQRAKKLRASSRPCSKLLTKKDKQLHLIFNEICALAEESLYPSNTEEAKLYAEKLYDAYVRFLTDCVSPDDFTVLCGGCDYNRK